MATKTLVSFFLLNLLAALSLAGGTTPSEQSLSETSLLHYWHFNNLGAGPVSQVPADLNVPGSATITYPGTGAGYMDDIDGSELNSRLGELAGKGLRVRNPSDTRTLHLTLPTTGYENVQVSYAVTRTNNGAESQVVEYRTTAGGNWIQFGSPVTITTTYQIFTFDFSAIPAAHDNPDFQIQIRFGGLNATGTTGNNRFDNIVMEGTALENTLPPPQLTTPIPLQKLSESADGTIDLDTHFSSASSEGLSYTASVNKAGLITLDTVGSNLNFAALQRGEVTITVAADDGSNPPVETAFRVLVFPQPHALADEPFAFHAWDDDHPEGTFPEHMLFLQSDLTDPTLTAPLEYAYSIPADDYHPEDSVGFPYNNANRTRINGLGTSGISFINTGRDRDLGGALLALDTTGLETAFVSWTGGTIEPNSRIYRIRLQYRTADNQAFTDLLNDQSSPVEYIRNVATGHSQRLGPVALPPAALNQPNLQLLWRYYYTGQRLDELSGARDRLRLDDILVTIGEADQQATRLAFDAAPPAAQSHHLAFPFVVTAVTDVGVTDGNFEGAVTLSVESGPGELSGNLSGFLQQGSHTFDDLVFSEPGLYTLRISGAGLDPAISDTIQVTGLTEIVMPRYMQGHQDALGANNDRIPFAYRLTIEGLTPGATYRYGNRVVVPEDPIDQNGGGNMIFATGPQTPWMRSTDAPRFLNEDFGVRHYTFTTDENGAYTGWFVTEPTGNDRFTPGNTVTLRILLNDGAGGENAIHYLNTNGPIMIIPFGEAAGDGSAVMGQASYASRNFVLLYDNEDGNERPLAAVPVEITGSEIDSRYAAFYHETVSTQDRHWGAIVPNILPAGIRRIEERSFDDGSILHVRQAPAGFAETVNPTHGLAPLDLGGIISTYEQWRAETFADPTGGTDPNADPLGQGITNLMRYAFDIALDQPGRDRLPRIISEEGALFLVFPYREAATDIAYVVESSPDLSNWNETLFDTQIATAEPDPEGNLRIALTPSVESTRQFFRVRLLLDAQ